MEIEGCGKRAFGGGSVCGPAQQAVGAACRASDIGWDWSSEGRSAPSLALTFLSVRGNNGAVLHQ